MSSIVYCTSKSGIKYAYQSESYWDKEKKQPRCRRKLLGRVDENGNIVPTGKRGRPKKTETPATPSAVSPEVSEGSETEDLKKQLTDVLQENQRLQQENAYLKKILDSFGRQVQSMNDLLARIPDQNS